MAVLDLTQCPICHARDSLTRQTVQLESRTHVTYECQACGTLLAWLGDDMWLDADRWSFQKVGRPEHADLLYRSMTVAELRKLAGEPIPANIPDVIKQAPRANAPPVWIDLPPEEGVRAEEERHDEELEELVAEVEDVASEPVSPAGDEPDVAAAAVVAAAVSQEEPAAEIAEPAAVAAASPIRAGPVAETDEPVGAAVAEPELPEPGAEPPAEAAAGPPPPRSAQRRRSRGSPFLVISVGFVLLFLICAAAAMIIYSMVSNFPGDLPVNPTAVEVTPVETAVSTDTVVPSPTPSPVPTEAAGKVEFQGVTDYLSGTGSHYLVGEVLNTTDDSLRFIEVLATFYDAAGQVTGTGSTFAELGIVEPGSTAPFKLTTLGAPDIARYDLRVDYQTTMQSPIRLEITGHSGAADGTGWYRVAGEVRNPHDFAVKFPEIVATYYSATHDVLRVEANFSDLDVLEPGQSSPFEVVLTDPPADLHHYALQTEAVQQ
jgi:Na+-transporting methylmalonyl-CoA/oxaloacetate decarboxylase gamma subunit